MAPSPPSSTNLRRLQPRKRGPMRPYDWQMAGDFYEWPHPVDLLMDGETDPDAIRFAMAAHLSEMALETEQSVQGITAARERLEKALMEDAWMEEPDRGDH